MSQQRLNHVALLNIHKSLTDKLGLKVVGNEFISACTSRENVFGNLLNIYFGIYISRTMKSNFVHFRHYFY